MLLFIALNCQSNDVFQTESDILDTQSREIIKNKKEAFYTVYYYKDTREIAKNKIRKEMINRGIITSWKPCQSNQNVDIWLQAKCCAVDIEDEPEVEKVLFGIECK